jgi:hypothetical protein
VEELEVASGVFNVELGSVRETCSGARGQPGLRQLRDDGGDVGASILGLNRLIFFRDGRKFFSWPRSSVYVVCEEDVRSCSPERWWRRGWR